MYGHVKEHINHCNIQLLIQRSQLSYRTSRAVLWLFCTPAHRRAVCRERLYCSNCEVEVFQSSSSGQGSSAQSRCVGWGHSLKCLKVCLWRGLASSAHCPVCQGLRQLCYQVVKGSEESGRKERERCCPGVSASCGCVCWPAAASRGDWATCSILMEEQKVRILAGSSWKQTG